MKKLVYAFFFIALNILYLIIELSFNAYLLDVSAAMSLAENLDQLELYGRSISAAGATLLFWRLLIPFKKQLTVGRTLLKFLIITLIVFPTVFMGQKKIIDYLVDSSSAEMRRSAEILSVLKYGIAHGFVEIDELSLDELTLKSAEGKMFVALAGLLIYSSDEELEKIDTQLDVIARYAITTQEQRETQTSYRHYQYAALKIAEKYKQYAAIVEQYDEQQNAAYGKSVALYQQALNYALSRWSSFEVKKLNLEYVYQQKKEQLTTYIKQLNDDLKHCSDFSCANKSSINTLSSINKLLGAQSTWQHWCNVEPIQSSINCVSQNNVVTFKLKKITEQYLVQQFGFERFYQNKLDYLSSREFYELFLVSLENNQVPLLSERPLTQHALIIEGIRLQIIQYLQQNYQNEMTQLMGEPVRSKLNIAQFTLLPTMQALFQKALGEAYPEALPINLTRQQFLTQVVQPIYSKQFDYLKNKLSSDVSWYEQGAPYAESGKHSLRQLVIPPVAIIMSLVFGLLNLISLVLNIVFLLIKENTIKRWLGFLVLVGALVVMPRFHQYLIADQTAFVKLVNQVPAEYGLVSDVALWLIKVEPAVYSVGNILRVNTLDGFEFD